MANGNVDLPANEWVQIADAGLTAASWQTKGDGSVFVAATSADSAPTGDYEDWPRYRQSEGEAGLDATALFSGVSGASYLWAYSPGKANVIWRSHAAA